MRATAGAFWIGDEYSPSLVHADRTGKILKRYIPEQLSLEAADYPVAKALPAVLRQAQDQPRIRGAADEQTLYLVLHSPLLNPDRKNGDASRNTRVPVFDIGAKK